MNQSYTATASITILAPPAKVWEALTQPELIKQYLFGTQVTTDWQVGSPITYSGEWEGKAYEDKGEILEIEPEKLLVSTFWSVLSGMPDIPENYNTVRYELSPIGSGTTLTIRQDNNATQEDATYAEGNWNMVLNGLKALLTTENKTMTSNASGTFEVNMTPQQDPEEHAAIGRMLIDKQFHGHLEASSKGQMLAYRTAVESSAGYVAMEQVEGMLNGRYGTFVLQHSGTMNRGESQLTLTVVPDSGTSDLAGLAGEMEIIIEDGQHAYRFAYTFLEKPTI